MFCRKIGSAFILLFLSTTVCAADELPTPFPWTETVQVGYSGTGGNSTSSNLTGKFTSLYKRNKWVNTYKVDALQSSSGGTTNAQRFGSSAEFNYDFKPQFFSFLRGSSVYDQFNSFDLTTIAATGLGKRLFENDQISIDAQAGPGYRITRVAQTSVYYRDVITFISTAFDWEISDDASFQENLSTEIGKNNTATKLETVLSTTIINNFDLELSFTISHNSTIPAGTTLTQNTDYRTDVTLLYSFT